MLVCTVGVGLSPWCGSDPSHGRIMDIVYNDKHYNDSLKHVLSCYVLLFSIIQRISSGFEAVAMNRF